MTPRLHNRTRTTASIPRKLLRKGRVLEIPLYYALRLSDLAREGLDHSGSHRFADHIYRNVPSGRGPVGRWLDARLLGLPAVRSFRSRYLAARDGVTRVVLDRLRCGGDAPIRVVSVPCGIPRELAEAAHEIRREIGDIPDRVEFHGMDLDPDVIDEARAFALARGLRGFRGRVADAFDRGAYPEAVSCITCTGLAEFLADDDLARLYGVFLDALEPGGLLITSGMQRRGLSDYLLRLAEIRTYYRGSDDLSRLAARLPWRDVRLEPDAVGLQTIMTAIR